MRGGSKKRGWEREAYQKGSSQVITGSCRHQCDITLKSTIKCLIVRVQSS